jgi:hypothetical protein
MVPVLPTGTRIMGRILLLTAGASLSDEPCRYPLSASQNRTCDRAGRTLGAPHSTGSPGQRIGAPEMARAMTSRWISDVPSKIV